MENPKKSIIVFLLFVTFASCKKEEAAPKSQPPVVVVTNPVDTTPVTPENIPSFTLISDIDLKVSLSDFKDKVVVLFFFGNGCASCKATSPSIQKTFVESYDESKVQVVGLDTWDGNLASVKSFKNASKLTFPLLLNASGVAKDFNTSYDRLIIVDKKGIVRFKGSKLAGNDLDDAKKIVDEYLSK